MAEYVTDAYIDYHEEGCQQRLASLEENKETAYWVSYSKIDGVNAVVITDCPENQFSVNLPALIQATIDAAKRRRIKDYSQIAYLSPIPETVIRMMIEGTFDPNGGA